jgi:hypothetical protein
MPGTGDACSLPAVPYQTLPAVEIFFAAKENIAAAMENIFAAEEISFAAEESFRAAESKPFLKEFRMIIK